MYQTDLKMFKQKNNLLNILFTENFEVERKGKKSNTRDKASMFFQT